MGTITTSSYATIHMDKFKNTHIYPEIKTDFHFYVRYIDDTFILFTGWEAKLKISDVTYKW